MGKLDPQHPDRVYARCTFCDGAADAYWEETGAVYVCRACALRVLPALLADAIYPRQAARRADGVTDAAERALSEAHAGFWRAFASRLREDLVSAQTKAREAADALA